MVSRAAIAEEVKKHGLRVGKDFADAIDGVVIRLVSEAIERAKWNKRRTVRAADLAFPVSDLGAEEAPSVPKITTERIKTQEEPVTKEAWIGRGANILRIGTSK